MISIKNITKVYKNKFGEKQVILENTSYSFKKGIKTSILGHSGSGKTTLLNLLSGLDHDFSGELLFNGNTITDFDKYRRENISFIFQDSNLINHHNLIDNIKIGITNDVKNRQKVALTLLKKVGLLEHAYKLPNQLSGGERQRVAIARALARDTDILLCDEPTGNLDDDTTEEIMKLIMEVSEKKTVIFITHDKELAEKYSDEIIKVESKKIIVTRSYEKENDANLSVSVEKKNKNFNKRFYKNILAKRINLITSSILIILLSSIFLLGTGINKGIIDEVDNYIINTYKVDKINLEIAIGKEFYNNNIAPMSIKGLQYVIDQENNKNGKNINGFTVSGFIDTYIGDFDFDDNAIFISRDYDFDAAEKYFKEIYGEDANIIPIDSLSNITYLLYDDIRENVEKDIVYGRYPETTKEILLSKGNAIRTIAKYKYSLKISEKEKQKCLDEILNFSDEQLFNEIKKLEITYIVDYFKDESSFEIVGLVDDYKYVDHYEFTDFYDFISQNFLTGISRYDSKMDYNIYLLEDDFAYIHGGENEYKKLKFRVFSIFLKEENLKLRQKVFSSIIEDNRHLFNGDDIVVSEYNKYQEFYKNYRLGILGVSTLLALFGCIVIYNSIKTIILRNRKNIGIYKSLGYTSKNIRSMFIKEGIIISLTIILMSIIVWSGMRFFVNDTVILLLDSTQKLGFINITRLSISSVIILFLIINLCVISPILRILNTKNIVKILN